MAIYQLGNLRPDIASSAYISEHAVLIGDIVIGENVSIWPGAVLRADNARIWIGAGSNIQDGAILHADPGLPLTIGSDVTVGHQAMLHGCTIGDACLIGIQAVPQWRRDRRSKPGRRGRPGARAPGFRAWPVDRRCSRTGGTGTG